jgi:hypothetical protein
MNWDRIALIAISASGAVGVLLAQTVEILERATKVARAWAELRKSLKS